MLAQDQNNIMYMQQMQAMQQKAAMSAAQTQNSNNGQAIKMSSIATQASPVQHDAQQAAQIPSQASDPVKKDNPSSKDELLKLIEEDFASGATYVYVNSLGKEVAFKEITVTQQKTLSRIMIGNERRKDIIYDAQCAIINNSALTEGFDVYDLTEFDRLKILIALYQANMFSNDVKFTCNKCGTENAYKLDFNNVLHRLDEIGLDPKQFVHESKNFKYEFVVQYPNVRRISSFYKSYCMQHKSGSKRDDKINDSMSNMEYINLFISHLKLTIKATGAVRNIDFTQYKASDVEDILAKFPQDALYTDDGVLNFIATEYLKKINDSFDKHECFQCGAVQEDDNTNQVEGFL